MNKKFLKKNVFKISVFFLNTSIFIINIIFLKDNNNLFEFKNADKFLIYFSILSINNISNILYNKYFITKNLIKSQNKSFISDKVILIDCVDFLFNNRRRINYGNYLNNIFIKRKINYKFKIDEIHPEYILYDVFGCQHLSQKYKNSIKIAIYSENKIPDFNEADYALGQSHFIYLDRYFKYPSFIWRLNMLKNLFGKINNSNKKKFCAAVISNNNSYSNFRLQFIKELNKYKKVDMGGKALNNIGRIVKDKIKFLSSYKFSISMENSNGDGYISEKIIESYISQTIPIYYGDYMIDEYINPKSFILIKNEKDMVKKIEFIKKIDNDNVLYKSILKEKIFKENIMDIINKNQYEREEFFFNIFKQNRKIAIRIDNSIKVNCSL